MSSTDTNVVLGYDEYKERKRKANSVPTPDWEDGCYTYRGGERVKYKPETKFDECPDEVQYTEGLLSGRTLFKRLWKRERGNNINNRTRNDSIERYQRDKQRFIVSLVSQLRLPEQIESEVIAKASSEDFQRYNSYSPYGGLIAGTLAIASVMIDRRRASLVDDFKYTEDRIRNNDELRLAEDFREVVEHHDVKLREAESKYKESLQEKRSNKNDKEKRVEIPTPETTKGHSEKDAIEDDTSVVGDIRPQDVEAPA